MFNTALTGLKAANAELGVTSNNIANVGSIGFKGSRAEFTDIYSSSVLGNSRTGIGGGALLTMVRQQHKQGSFEYTDSGLDMSINGQGYFAVSGSKDVFDATFTRAGAFGLDKDGYVVNADGAYLQTFPVEEDTGDTLSTASSSLQAVQVRDTYGTPSASTRVNIGANLPSDEPDLPIGSFDRTQPDTYSKVTSSQVYDSLGNPHTLQVYYVKTNSATNTWDTRTFLDDTQMTPTGSEDLAFNSDGTLSAPATGEIAYDPVTLVNGATPMELTLDYKTDGSEITQFAAPFYVSELSHNGSSTGRLSGLEVGQDGLMQAKYTNGRSRYLGKVAMADFTSQTGLKQVGNASWQESSESGDARFSEPNTGRLGGVSSGSLETSNVDLTTELIQLIKAQRNFQANAKSIETGSTLTQTIINLG